MCVSHMTQIFNFPQLHSFIDPLIQKIFIKTFHISTEAGSRQRFKKKKCLCLQECSIWGVHQLAPINDYYFEKCLMRDFYAEL